ncbi:Glycine betaine methyltransferase [subsurface metagenome]
MLKGFTRKFKPLEILTEDQIEEIHTRTLEVLWVTGIRIEHERALKLFEREGCQVDYDEMTVHFPASLVEECLQKAPGKWHTRARDRKNDLIVGRDTVYFGVAPGMQTIDLDTWKPRVATMKENYDAVRVLDALPNLHFFSPYTPYFGFGAVPPVMGMLESVAARIRNSTKFQYSGYSHDCEIFTIEIGRAAGMEILGTCALSPPLTMYRDAAESTFRFVEAGFPVRVISGAVMGGTAPATVAGSTITNNAEVIAGVLLTQLIRPRTRVLAKDLVFPQNMRSGAPVFGAIEIALHNVVFNQIWRRYDIPRSNTTCYPSSKRIDFQSGYEKSQIALIAALSGVNSMLLHGSVHGELTHHPLQAVLDDDVAGRVGRFITGVEVNDETLAVSLIEEVGAIPGHYLNKEHTRKWWKKEFFLPQAADVLTYPEWMKSGKKHCLDYAKERMEKILATHKVSIPLTPGQEDDIGRILNEARKYYRKKGMISDEEWEVYKKKVLESPDYPYG